MKSFFSKEETKFFKDYFYKGSFFHKFYIDLFDLKKLRLNDAG